MENTFDDISEIEVASQDTELSDLNDLATDDLDDLEENFINGKLIVNCTIVMSTDQHAVMKTIVKKVTSQEILKVSYSV